MTPSAYWSDAGVAASPRHCSGLMYAGVPSIEPATVIERPDTILAMPKSVTTGRPRASMMMLDGLTSRCTTPSECANCSASATCLTTKVTPPGSWGRRSRRSSSSVRPSRYFITMNNRPARCLTEYTVTMPGWSRCAAVLASITKRSWVPATSVRSGSITLMATRRSSAMSRARKTAAMPPRPISPSIVYSSAVAARTRSSRMSEAEVIQGLVTNWGRR